MLKKFLLTFVLVTLSASVSAQDAPADNTAPPPAPGPGSFPPCLRQAGVSMSTVEQLRSIAESARLEVVNVCLDESLNAQQRHQQLHSIHLRAHQKMEDLITPAQQRSFIACRQRHREPTHVEWFEHPGGDCRARGAAAGAPAPRESDAPAQKNDSQPQKDESSPQRN